MIGHPSAAQFPTFDVPSASDEASTNVLPGNAKEIGKAPVSMPCLVKALSFVNVKSRGDMLSMVSGFAQKFQILKAVVSLIAVAVMNMLVCFKGATKMLFHNNSMLVSLPTVDGNDTIPGLVQPMLKLPCEFARFRAKARSRKARAEISGTMSASAYVFHVRQNTANHSTRQPIFAEGVE